MSFWLAVAILAVVAAFAGLIAGIISESRNPTTGIDQFDRARKYIERKLHKP